MRKWVVRSLVGLLCVIVLSIVVLFFFIRHNYSPEKLKRELEVTLYQRSGFHVTIGDLSFSFSGDIRLRHICVQNPRLISARCVVAAEVVALDLRLLPLLRKQLEIQSASLDKVEIHLFEEVRDIGGKKQIVHSWDLPARESASPTDTAAPQFTLRRIVLKNGLLTHEVLLLPIDKGNYHFGFSLEARAQTSLQLQIANDDGMAVAAILGGTFTDVIASAQSLAAHGKLLPSDTVTGSLTTSNFSLQHIDARAGKLTGKITLTLQNNQLTLESAQAELNLLQPLTALFTQSGKATLALPGPTLVRADGTLAAPGFKFTYREMTHAAGKGLTGLFNTDVDLARASSLFGLTVGTTGALHLEGALQGEQASGGLNIAALHYPVRKGISVDAAKLQASFFNAIIKLHKQELRIADSSTIADISLQNTASGKSIKGSLVFDKLPLGALLGDGEAGKDEGTTTSIPRFAADLHVKARSVAYGKLVGTSLTTRFIREGQKMQLENTAFTFARGRINATYSRQLASSAQSLHLSARGVKAQDLSHMFALKGTVFSDVAADAKLSFSGDTALALRQTLSGHATLRFGRGKIKDSFFQRGIFNGPLHKLEEKFSDIEFASAVADIVFDKGSIRTQKIFFDAEEWSAALRAESAFDFKGKATLDFRFRSSFVENVANPLHMGIQGRKEGEFYDLPFACRGNVVSGDCYKANW
ncbi:MAG: hypothetical protein JSR44_02685 [Spirochaetes bacterium]|nr:hypothetical protein [Spirochaetota bacterium]